MTHEAFHEAVVAFVLKFNKMCEQERKDFLVREYTVNYESGPSIQQHSVTYKVSNDGDVWEVNAERGFWVFKSKYPLIRITKDGDMASISGLYTKALGDFEASQIEEKLDAYIEICRKLPQDAFVKS